MNIGKTAIQIVLVYLIYAILMGGSEALLLADQMEATMAMARPEPMMGLIYGAYLLGTIAFVVLYGKLIGHNCPKAGAFYGAMVGLIYVEMGMVNYGFLPMPTKVFVVNSVFILLASVISGAVIAKMQPATESAD